MGFFRRILGRESIGHESDFDKLVAQSIEELKLKTSAHDALWRLGEADWNLDQDLGLIVFTNPAGIKATCSVQIIGTFNTDDDTWLWGWEHPSVVPALQEHAKRVRAYGEKHGIERLTTRKFRCEETDAWEYTALACKLCQAEGGYRGPSDRTRVFMTFSNLKLSQ